MANIIRKGNKLTGLVRYNNPKSVLNRIYSNIFHLLEKMPPQCGYRKYTEDIIRQRASIINSTDDINIMEEKIGCGQIDEIVVQARNELELTRQMLLARPWEQLSTPIPKNQWKWPVK